MVDLKKIQTEVREWTKKNFKDPDTVSDAVYGLQEELGEISHILLKRKQEIRLDEDLSDKALMDGVGDLIIYLFDFCNRVGIDLEESLVETWKVVRKRDWNKHRAKFKGKDAKDSKR